MGALLGLAGAVVGGFLVLLGDATRRRAQRRQDEVRRLAEAATGYAVIIGRLVADVRESLERGEAPVKRRADRYEASLRFFMTPGAEELYPEAMAIVNAYLAYAAVDPSQKERILETDNYFEAQKAFELKTRSIFRRGTIGQSMPMGYLKASPGGHPTR
jgi:hypothetical protein